MTDFEKAPKNAKQLKFLVAKVSDGYMCVQGGKDSEPFSYALSISYFPSLILLNLIV